MVPSLSMRLLLPRSGMSSGRSPAPNKQGLQSKTVGMYTRVVATVGLPFPNWYMSLVGIVWQAMKWCSKNFLWCSNQISPQQVR